MRMICWVKWLGHSELRVVKSESSRDLSVDTVLLAQCGLMMYRPRYIGPRRTP